MSKKFMARAVAILIAAASLGGATSLAAVAAPSSCSSGYVCVYDKINYGAKLGDRTAGFALQDISSGNNDKMSSWSNNSVLNACWYSNAGGGGFSYQMNQFTDNSDVGIWSNDRMSSWKGSSC